MRNPTGIGLALGAMVLAAALGAAVGQAEAQDYEVWALDQGTGTVHIYSSKLEEVGRIDLAAQGGKTPHMIDFNSDHSYAVIASPGSGDVTIIRTADRSVAAVLKTGPGTHMASVKPDDSAILVDVIGDGKVERDGKVVEITADWQAGKFELGRSLVIAEDPLFVENADKFNDVGAICHDYSGDGRHAYVTLGPALKDAGLVVLDTEAFKLVKVFAPDEVKANCGTLLTPDGKHMLVNGGSAEAGLWYAIDTSTLEVTKQGESGGKDAHGVWATPDGKEIWMVNRVSSNGVVLDPVTFEVKGELVDIGKTPDIVAMSPDSQFAFISLRGPNPVTAAHVAKGETPGFAVVDVKGRKLSQVIQPAQGNEQSDFHGIGVRRLP